MNKKQQNKLRMMYVKMLHYQMIEEGEKPFNN